MGTSRCSAQQIGLDETVKVAVEHSISIADFMTCTVILDHPVGMEDIGADLASPGNLLLLASQSFGFALLLFRLQFVDTGFELLHCHCPVLVLGTFILAADHDSGRNMGDADR